MQNKTHTKASSGETTSLFKSSSAKYTVDGGNKERRGISSFGRQRSASSKNVTDNFYSLSNSGTSYNNNNNNESHIVRHQLQQPSISSAFASNSTVPSRSTTPNSTNGSSSFHRYERSGSFVDSLGSPLRSETCNDNDQPTSVTPMGSRTPVHSRPSSTLGHHSTVPSPQSTRSASSLSILQQSRTASSSSKQQQQQQQQSSKSRLFAPRSSITTSSLSASGFNGISDASPLSSSSSSVTSTMRGGSFAHTITSGTTHKAFKSPSIEIEVFLSERLHEFESLMQKGEAFPLVRETHLVQEIFEYIIQHDTQYGSILRKIKDSYDLNPSLSNRETLIKTHNDTLMEFARLKKQLSDLERQRETDQQQIYELEQENELLRMQIDEQTHTFEEIIATTSSDGYRHRLIDKIEQIEKTVEEEISGTADGTISASSNNRARTLADGSVAPEAKVARDLPNAAAPAEGGPRRVDPASSKRLRAKVAMLQTILRFKSTLTSMSDRAVNGVRLEDSDMNGDSVKLDIVDNHHLAMKRNLAARAGASNEGGSARQAQPSSSSSSNNNNTGISLPNTGIPVPDGPELDSIVPGVSLDDSPMITPRSEASTNDERSHARKMDHTLSRVARPESAGASAFRSITATNNNTSQNNSFNNLTTTINNTTNGLTGTDIVNSNAIAQEIDTEFDFEITDDDDEVSLIKRDKLKKLKAELCELRVREGSIRRRLHLLKLGIQDSHEDFHFFDEVIGDGSVAEEDAASKVPLSARTQPV